MLQKRRSQSSEEIERKSALIQNRLLTFSLFLEGRGVLFYLAMEDEVQTRPIIERALAMGKTISVPLIEKGEREILPSILKDPDKELTPGPWGILEPNRKSYRPCPLEDKFLRKLPERVNFVALAFELQVVGSLPFRSHDVAVDYIITEKRIIQCGESTVGG